MSSLFCKVTRDRSLLVIALAAVVLLIVGPLYANANRQRPPHAPSRNHHRNGSGNGPKKNGAASTSVSKEFEDLRKEWTSSPYCRLNVDHHEQFVRSESKAATGASKVSVVSNTF